MLTQEQRNDRIAIIAALQGSDAANPLVRAVIADLQHMARRAQEQIAFVGDIPDYIYIPPLSDEAERVALAIWSGKFDYAVSWQIQTEIRMALELQVSLPCPPPQPQTVWLN
jgi:hypothetical protein